MIDKIIEIINEWNPIEIYPLLKDEYNLESKKLNHAVRKSNSIEELAEEVFSIFKQSFGKQFSKSIEECRVISEELMKYK